MGPTPARRAQRPAPHHLHRGPRRARRHQGIRTGHRLAAWSSGTVWSATVPNTLFGDFNPFAEEIDGDWIVYADANSPKKHLGEVYLNGTSFYEVDLT